MTKYLRRYNEIMKLYRSGAFGQDHLTMHDILSQAGEDGLFDKMCLSEVNALLNSASGMSKHLFRMLLAKRERSISNIAKLEKELESFNLQNYCDADNLTIDVLARNLNLDIEYNDTPYWPQHIEATLSPPTNETSYGVIKISNKSDNQFSYMHEIMHYFRDVGVGKVVSQEYTRKSKGNTDSPEEQEINYLAAAAVMPIAQIIADLEIYERTPYDKDADFFVEMARKYKQDIQAISRRFVEVRSLLDSGYRIYG